METPLKSDFQDIYKRANKELFYQRAIAGDLELENGGKLKAIPKDDFTLVKLMSVNNHEDLSAEERVEIRNHLKSNWGVKFSDISKDLNGFSTRSGGKNPTGEDWEALIVAGVNKLTGKRYNVGDEWERIEKYWAEYEEPATKVAEDYMKKLGVSDAKQYGASSVAITSEWKKFGASNTTPKTDIVSGKYKVSLKKSGGSQLLSAKKEETLATFNAALMTYGDSSSGAQEVRKLMDSLKEKMVSLSYRDTITNVDKLKNKQNLTDKEIAKIEELDNARLGSDELNKQIGRVFEDKLFKSHFCFEAATGNTKFGKDSIASSNVIVTFRDTGNISDILHLTSPETAGAQLSKGNDFYVSFKSSSGSAPYLSFRSKKLSKGALNKMLKEDTFAGIIHEELKSENFLTEDMQQLDEFAMFKNLSRKLRNASGEVKAIAQRVMERIMKRVSEAFDFIAKLGKRALKGLMNFFGIKVDKITISKSGGKYPLNELLGETK